MIRDAKISDVKTIHKLLEFYSLKGDMLPRSLIEIYENIRDFFVYEENGQIIGVCALHVCWEDIAEVRSLAVREGEIKKGLGTKLVKHSLSCALQLGIKKVFALTYKGKFFKKIEFIEIDKQQLPQKIWTDCIKCVKFPNCDEVAYIYEFKS